MPLNFSLCSGNDQDESCQVGRSRGHHQIGGQLCSLILHILVLLLIVGLSSNKAPSQKNDEQTVPVNLVPFADLTTALLQKTVADTPQEAAPIASGKELSSSVVSPSHPTRVTHQAAKSELRTTQERISRNDFDHQLLAAEAEVRQASQPSNPHAQDGLGVSNVTADRAKAFPGRHAGYGVHDFIRGQIEKHWNFDTRLLGKEDMVISLHLVLGRDGTVMKAEVVDDPNHTLDPRYQEIAASARRAALVGSPLQIPSGSYEAVADMVLKFDARASLH